MKIGVIGPRIHGRPDLVRALVRSFPPGTVLVSGGGDGVDTWAEEEATAVGHGTDIHRPATMTRDALLARNAKVAEASEELHAFLWPGARGTHHTLGLARKRGIPIHIHKAEPRVEVFTARWGLKSEPDILNIMRGWAEKNQPSAAWRNLDHDTRLRRAVTYYEAKLRAGESMLATQRAAAKDGVPQLGSIWAPTRSLLNTGLNDRKRLKDITVEVQKLRAGWAKLELGDEPDPAEKDRELGLLAEAESLAQAHWPAYSAAFLLQMRKSFQSNELGWGWLLARPRVVLACQCQDPAACHRSLVATALAAFGAVSQGEIG